MSETEHFSGSKNDRTDGCSHGRDIIAQETHIFELLGGRTGVGFSAENGLDLESTEAALEIHESFRRNDFFVFSGTLDFEMHGGKFALVREQS